MVPYKLVGGWVSQGFTVSEMRWTEESAPMTRMWMCAAVPSFTNSGIGSHNWPLGDDERGIFP